MTHHVVAVRTYFFIFVALLLLTGATTAVAFENLGPLNTVAALAIAVTKALLVILFFMHVRSSGPMTRIVIVAGFLWLVILLTLTLSDYLTRPWTPAASGWETASGVSPTPLPSVTRLGCEGRPPEEPASQRPALLLRVSYDSPRIAGSQYTIILSRGVPF